MANAPRLCLRALHDELGEALDREVEHSRGGGQAAERRAFGASLAPSFAVRVALEPADRAAATVVRSLRARRGSAGRAVDCCDRGERSGRRERGHRARAKRASCASAASSAGRDASGCCGSAARSVSILAHCVCAVVARRESARMCALNVDSARARVLSGTSQSKRAGRPWFERHWPTNECHTRASSALGGSSGRAANGISAVHAAGRPSHHALCARDSS